MPGQMSLGMRRSRRWSGCTEHHISAEQSEFFSINRSDFEGMYEFSFVPLAKASQKFQCSLRCLTQDCIYNGQDHIWSQIQKATTASHQPLKGCRFLSVRLLLNDIITRSRTAHDLIDLMPAFINCYQQWA